ncbi:MAG: hypothetical protein WCR67_07045 [Bacilli bacterium]
MEAKIRNFLPKDRERLKAICKETAWDDYKKDSNKLETVPIMFLDYFMDYESNLIFVAINEKDEAIGYIECASSYHDFIKINKQVYFPLLKKIDKSQIRFIKTFFLLYF